MLIIRMKYVSLQSRPVLHVSKQISPYAIKVFSSPSFEMTNTELFLKDTKRSSDLVIITCQVSEMPRSGVPVHKLKQYLLIKFNGYYDTNIADRSPDGRAVAQAVSR
jgi:hypothetical protein